MLLLPQVRVTALSASAMKSRAHSMMCKAVSHGRSQQLSRTYTKNHQPASDHRAVIAQSGLMVAKPGRERSHPPAHLRSDGEVRAVYDRDVSPLMGIAFRRRARQLASLSALVLAPCSLSSLPQSQALSFCFTGGSSWTTVHHPQARITQFPAPLSRHLAFSTTRHFSIVNNNNKRAAAINLHRGKSLALRGPQSSSLTMQSAPPPPDQGGDFTNPQAAPRILLYIRYALSSTDVRNATSRCLVQR